MTGISGDFNEARVPLMLRHVFGAEDYCALMGYVRRRLATLGSDEDEHGLSRRKLTLSTLHLFATAIEPDRNILAAIILEPFLEANPEDADEISRLMGDDVLALLRGLQTVGSFSNKNSVANQENYRGLLVSLAEDIRVIIIMIVRSLALMRMINHHPDDKWVRNVAFEANCLYAQLAHRLGLYKIKGELEDLSLKYTNRDIYTQIARKLNETKRERDAYIESFIGPVRQRLQAAGLRFEIKGRTKSISSIWAKIQKQKVDLNGIYDLFAIRVIIDTPREREKRDCWMAYSIVADMYTANPARMKDWISIPKSNGYESLHATVNGPGNKWVEVQFRSRRMDLIAEKGLAAHWRYKGGKSDATDQWMNNIRDILETADSGPMELMRNMKLDVFGKEVFVFTPKGDLLRLAAGSTVLDFAFSIHSNIGCRCTGAVVNGRHQKINYRLRNGDTVEVKTSATQHPKQDWLNIVVSNRARNKIRQSLNEAKLALADSGKEMLERRARNRKLEIDESLFMRFIKKRGYKQATDFYADLGDEKLDAGKLLSEYQQFVDEHNAEEVEKVSAEEYRLNYGCDEEKDAGNNGDVLTIGGDCNVRGLKYKFARCCNPIAGDEVFGFVSSDGMVKIHKKDCPNAAHICRRYPYRLINVQWSGAKGGEFAATLRVVGIDDIGIVTNITSIISKDEAMNLRNISIDSDDGIFRGYLVINVRDTRQLTQLIKKIRNVKGVKDVSRV